MLLNIALELQTIMHIVIFSDQDSLTKKAIFPLKPQSPGWALFLLELLDLIWQKREKKICNLQTYFCLALEVLKMLLICISIF